MTAFLVLLSASVATGRNRAAPASIQQSRLRGGGGRVRGATATTNGGIQLRQRDNNTGGRFLKGPLGMTSKGETGDLRDVGDRGKKNANKSDKKRGGGGGDSSSAPVEETPVDDVTGVAADAALPPDELLPVSNTGDDGEETGRERKKVPDKLRDIAKRGNGKKKDHKKFYDGLAVEAPIVVDDEPVLAEAAVVTPAPTLEPTQAPTPEPTQAPTPKPTPRPTWTFVVETPQIVEEAAFESCGYCSGRCFDDAPLVTFSQGSSATCGHIRDVAKTLRMTQCNIERKIIEETCCCDDEPSSRAEIVRTFDWTQPACSFCPGMEFNDDSIINFSSGNDSVSCGGLMTLVRSGLPSSFCDYERTYIEEACCQPIAGTPAPIAEAEVLIDEFLEEDDDLSPDGNSTDVVEETTSVKNPFIAAPFIEDSDSDDPPSRPGRPAHTIAEGGKRESKPLGSVNRQRKPVAGATSTASSRIDDNEASGGRQPMYDPNQSRASNRLDSAPMIFSRAELSPEDAATGEREVEPLYKVTRNEDRTARFPGRTVQHYDKTKVRLIPSIHRGDATVGN